MLIDYCTVHNRPFEGGEERMCACWEALPDGGVDCIRAKAAVGDGRDDILEALGGESLDWCVEHRQPGLSLTFEPHCQWAQLADSFGTPTKYSAQCRMVKAVIVLPGDFDDTH